MPELGLAKEVPPTRGSKDVGLVSVVSNKTLWINIDCLGDGLLKLDFQQGVFSIPCKASHLTPTRNQMKITLPSKIKVRVEAPQTVEWSLRIQQ
jgi:hypothetical protein